MNKLLIIAILGFAVACGSTKEALTTADYLTHARTVYPDVTEAQLAQGKQVYENNCTKCHALKPFKTLDAQGWKNIIPPMVEKAKKKGSEINAEQLESLTRYLVSMSSM